MRIGASYSRDTSRVPFGQLVEVGLSGLGPIVPVSDLSDLRSLVSNRGSCERTTMHYKTEILEIVTTLDNVYTYILIAVDIWDIFQTILLLQR